YEMAGAERRDPYRSFNFHVAFDGVLAGAFSEVSGLTVEGDAIDYRAGTDPQSNERRLTGLRKYANITLKRGYTVSPSLWNWNSNTTSAQSDRHRVPITLMNETQQPIMHWHCNNAWVTKIESPNLNASGNEVTVDSVEIAHEGLTIESLAK